MLGSIIWLKVKHNMKKKERLQIIKEVLEQEAVANQKELINLLAMRGVEVKQSAISRDLKTLNYVKVANPRGGTRYQLIAPNVSHKPDKFNEIVSEIMLSVTQIQFMNIVKTLPANGNLLAVLIEEQQLPDVVATLAGHDTIYITSLTEDAASRVNQTLAALLPLNGLQ